MEFHWQTLDISQVMHERGHDVEIFVIECEEDIHIPGKPSVSMQVHRYTAYHEVADIFGVELFKYFSVWIHGKISIKDDAQVLNRYKKKGEGRVRVVCYNPILMRQAVIVEAVRTPIGRAHREKGVFREVRADDLSALTMQALLARAHIPPELVEDVYWGCARQTEEQGYNIARQAALIAGFPVEVCGVTVNRNCGSSLEAINQAARSIATRCNEVLIAGGVEHMDHLPMGSGFNPSPKLLARHGVPAFTMGLTAENLASLYGISREEQDAFAIQSHHRAAAATDTGAFQREIVPMRGKDTEGKPIVVTQDQGIRLDTTMEALGALQPAFVKNGGTVTAGNSSQTSVGAAAALLMSSEKAKELGLKPKASIRSAAVAGVDPFVMGLGPVPAVRRALERAGLTLADIDVIELNEAFAAQALVVMRELGLDPAKVNIRGGAIALGHPLGASGARIAATLISLMEDRRAQFGLVAMCIGGGQGIATIFEKTE